MKADLAALKALTEEVSKHEEELDALSKQWQLVFDALPNPIFIIDINCKVKYINSALEKRLRINKDSVINGENTILNDVIHYMNDGAGKYKKSGRSFMTNLRGYFHYEFSPIYDEVKNLIGYVCLLNDVTRETFSG